MRKQAFCICKKQIRRSASRSMYVYKYQYSICDNIVIFVEKLMALKVIKSIFRTFKLLIEGLLQNLCKKSPAFCIKPYNDLHKKI